eukprot:TRINITY_DN12349_c0_g1_i3.p2 TRINITY_DN12349_c0_g1~~TRINITY_DN12349_c0_g1_i3.p2  ORF type:complete len:126 (+),score=32.05 TRINITY_DN12349_c0_g1_i3:73-450(+)
MCIRDSNNSREELHKIKKSNEVFAKHVATLSNESMKLKEELKLLQKTLEAADKEIQAESKCILQQEKEHNKLKEHISKLQQQCCLEEQISVERMLRVRYEDILKSIIIQCPEAIEIIALVNSYTS